MKETQYPVKLVYCGIELRQGSKGADVECTLPDGRIRRVLSCVLYLTRETAQRFYFALGRE